MARREGLDDGVHERRAGKDARFPRSRRRQFRPRSRERDLEAMTLHLALLLMVQASTQWPQHSMDRPRPVWVDPGPERPSAPPPKDAIVLFDGSTLSQWRAQDSTAAKWIVRDGYVEVKPGTGMLVSARG